MQRWMWGVVAAMGLLPIAAQAADAVGPSVAPVDYVQVCDAYGSGFFIVPGAETCLKIGGSVIVDLVSSLHEENGGLIGPLGWSRKDVGISSAVDARVTFEAISNTEFGPLQSYVGVRSRFQTSVALNTTTLTDAWIKWSGLTVGMHRSFFTAYTGGSDVVLNSVAGIDRDSRLDFAMLGTSRERFEGKPIVLAYTAAFGSGISASVSFEMPTESRNPRNTIIPDLLLPLEPSYYGGTRWPDVVANVRVEQSWGSAQVMGALHQVRSGSFFFAATGSHVDEIGYAVGVGGQLIIPGLPGRSYVAGQAAFAHGAVKFVDPSSPFVDFFLVGTLTDSWGVAGTLNLGVSQMVALQASASFGRHENGTTAADVWTAMGDVTVSPVDGLAFRAGAEYRHERITAPGFNVDGGELIGFFRVARTF
jgi:hypothetical protein